jgi:hypothetical protein
MTQPESSFSHNGAAAGPHSATEHCRAWLDWAATQVDLCLTEDKPACNRLLESLTAALEPGPPPRADAEVVGEASMSQKMAAVVVAVQSHDRVMQQLTHVRDALRLLHAHLGDANRAESGESWAKLREMQMREFTMTEERALFSRLAAHEEKDWLEVTVHPDETIELFIPKAGLRQP